MKVINFFGAPCAGKTTAALGLAYEMKKRYLKVELIQEAAKKHSYRKTEHMLADQMSILSEQHVDLFYYKDALDRNGKRAVNFVVMDSPILLSAFYMPDYYPESFRNFTLDMFNSYNNLNIYLERNHAYDQAGRYHTEAQAEEIHLKMMDKLAEWNIPIVRMLAGDDVPLRVMSLATGVDITSLCTPKQNGMSL
jgi:adenylate kinase family enzyme